RPSNSTRRPSARERNSQVAPPKSSRTVSIAGPALTAAISQVVIYEPKVRHCVALQSLPIAPRPPEILHAPSTASSGRKLTFVSSGRSYGFLLASLIPGPTH